MEERIGTPMHRNGWWLVSVIAVAGEPSLLVSLGPADKYQARPRDASLWHRAFGVSRKRPRTQQLALVASHTRAEDGQRAEATHRIVIDEQAGQLVAAFLEPAPASDAAAQLRDALLECLESAIGSAEGSGKSSWHVDQLLAALSQFDRIDDAADDLAFRIGAPSAQRTMYVHLYGGDPWLIHFDLEDPTQAPTSWDHRISSGAVEDVESLRTMAEAWLVHGGLPRSPE
ncbi:MAG: hypothetical protein JNK04_03395 [Myxococcales bacterium]|nr:hypothetical protein [Myxococcales bacterium]